MGADPREIYRNLNKLFFWSPEYISFNRHNGDFVTDLYWAYLNRGPDSGGLSYWTGLLDNQNLNRDVVQGNFQKSAEFDAYMTSQLGVAPQRPEISLVMDAFRGFLSRQPDETEGPAWRTYLREAQCGQASVATRAHVLVESFLTDDEYLARARSVSEYVADLYDAILGRGADSAGFGFWVSYTAQHGRVAAKDALLGSQEWSDRVAQIAAETCIP